ncbi:MAG TPA: 3-deoxy-7-phosphoheptulonate synthase [Polyangiaceae bacterium]|nr:3-deoxy-7-phosphoheptulonate synthase [Polyangiaceae bacterium]
MQSAHAQILTTRNQPSPDECPTPRQLADASPLSATAELHVRETRGRLRRRLQDGHGPLIVVVGPCSIHSEEAAEAYAERLEPVVRRLEDDLIIVLRAYFEKPRTTVGWKGFLYDPDLDGTNRLAEGLRRARAIASSLAERRLALATELLDPLASEFFEDQLSWAAIGARTAESQIHRQLASRVGYPVGIKNGTDGSVDVAAAAMLSAGAPHTHLGVDRNGRLGVLQSSGNPHTHVVLRGGKSGPNYDAASVGRIGEALVRQGLAPRVLVDASHGNSEKDHRRQARVVDAVVEQLPRSDVDVLGVMLESHLREGRQEASPEARPDCSVTDACIDFETTEALLERLAVASRARTTRPG